MKDETTLVQWLWAHSGLPERGPLCEAHPPISEMTGDQQVQALFEDAGVRLTRQWINQTAGRLGIPRRRQAKRVLSEEEKARRRQKGSARWRRWAERQKLAVA